MVHILLAVNASELHRFLDAPLKEVHNLLHPDASSPLGPAAPVVRRTVDLMRLASSESKMTGWAGCTSSSSMHPS